MVGTGHYSNKCGTCRRRKLKCGRNSWQERLAIFLSNTKLGEEKPRCIRCQRAGLECDGYVRDYKWVDEGAVRLVCLLATAYLFREGRAVSRGRKSARLSGSPANRSPEEEDQKPEPHKAQSDRLRVSQVGPSPSTSSTSSWSEQSDRHLLMEVRNRPPGATMQRNLFAFSDVRSSYLDKGLLPLMTLIQDVCVCFTIKRLFDGGPVMVSASKLFLWYH